MSSNRNLDRFYAECERRDSDFTNSGIDADKPGYHNSRDELLRDGRTQDYSISQVAADRRGRGSVSAANDLSLPPAKMRLYTGRLRAAAVGRDERLWLYGGPVLREFIGTLDGKSVYCYVLTGGAPLGVGADSGEDPGRGESHLWHIHLSWIRQYAEDWAAADAVLSVMFAEPLDAWRARTGRGTTMEIEGPQAKQLAYIDVRAEALANGTAVRETALAPAGGRHYAVDTLAKILATVVAMAEQLPDVDDAIVAQTREDFANLLREINEVPAEVIGSLPAHTFERAIDTLLAAGGEDWVANLGRAIVERYGAGSADGDTPAAG